MMGGPPAQEDARDRDDAEFERLEAHGLHPV